MHRTLFVFLVILGMTGLMYGQNMHVSWYSTANGLPSNEVRHITRDSLGFTWIATDAGLLRFDGLEFKDFSQYIPSQYARFLMATDEGLLLTHDAGISLIESGLDTVKISMFQKASVNPDDNVLYYPERIFERRNGDLWVGQPGGRVHSISSTGIKQIIPGNQDKTKRGLNLYFAEVSDQIWMADNKGSLSWYNDQSDIPEIRATFPVIHDMTANGNELWIASDKVYRIKLTSDGKNIEGQESFESIPGEVTALALDNKENIYLGIKGLGLYYLDRTFGKTPEFIKIFGNNDPHTLNELPFKNIHDIVFDKDNKLWVCSSEGLGILQRRFFESIGSIPNANATAISIAENGKVFVNFGDLYSIEKTDYGYIGEQLSTSALGTITALTAKGDRLWVGTSTGKLYELGQNGERIKAISLEERGEGIFYLAGDSRNRLWIAQAPRDLPIVGIGCVLPSGEFREYSFERGLENRIICLRETEKGRIYATGIGKDTYLYRYAPEKDRFVNLSIPFDFYIGPNFQVHDFTVDANGYIWLASTAGLLRYDMERVTKIDLGPDYSDLEVKAVTNSSDGSIWVSFNTEGVIRYDQNNTVSMKEESGLPSKVMTYRCIQADKEGRLWIGTAEGIVYSLNPNPKPGKSNIPLLISMAIDGRKITEKQPVILPDQELRIEYKAPSFHGFRTFYQYQINDSGWSLPTTKPTVTTKGFVPGIIKLAVRAKKEGPYLWSEAAVMQLMVKDQWYKSKGFRWGALAVLLAAVVFLFWSQKRKFRLALSKLNQGLEAKNVEVYKQEADLNKVREEMRLKQRERKANLLILEVMHRLISKIGPETKWELILETMSLDLLKLPGVIAFEIGVHRGKHIEFEGYSEKVRGFTSAKVPFDPGKSLAAYCITNAKAFIFKRLPEEATAILDKKDLRIGGYKAAISVPFYIKNNHAIITLYADKEDLFDEYTRKTIQIFATYLEQIV